MTTKPWAESMPEKQFKFMRDILAAPSPVGLEAAMTYGVIKPMFDEVSHETWSVHQFAGNAGIVLDTHPGRHDLLTVMLVGHADKIRMQVRSIAEDGKVYINTDSFLPSVLLGHEVSLFSEHPDKPGTWRVLEGGTVEALGAIHFADADTRSGRKGVGKEQIYLELQMHGANRKDQVEALGIRPGDPILFNRPIKRGFSPDTFYGAYLDNGLGCFVCAEVGRVLANSPALEHVRVQCAIATHEEIGRMGSRVMAGQLQPDVLIGVDVNHDYEAAPGIKDRRMTPLRMGEGFTLTTGAITSTRLNSLITEVAREHDIPMQTSVSGRDTGTDAMAGVFAAIDCAATSVGFPIRNMHTISETGHTGDVLASIHALHKMLLRMDQDKMTPDDFKNSHTRLDNLERIAHVTPASDD